MVGDSFLEDLYYKFYADEPDTEAVKFYYHRVVEEITLLVPSEEEGDISDHFYGLLGGLCHVQHMQGFTQGFQCATELLMESFQNREKSQRETWNEYEKTYPKETEVFKDRRAARGKNREGI